MAAQTPPNLDEILRALNVATDKGKLNWSTTAEDDTFRANLAQGMVRISKGLPPPRYILSLLDNDGTLLEEYQNSGEGELLALEALYKKARRRALNLGGKLHSVYSYLKQLGGEWHEVPGA